MIVPLAIGTDATLLHTIGPGIYWSIILLFGVLISVRQSAEEGRSQRDLLALLGIDPAARYAGGAIATPCCY